MVAYIFLNDSPITTRAYCRRIVPIGPELSTPQVFLERWVIQEQLLGGDAFEDPYDLADAVFGMEAYQQMNVILVIAELLDDQIVPLFNAFHSLTQSGNSFRTQQSLAVLHGKDEVVMGVVRTVVAFGDWHTISIAASEGNLRFPSDSLPSLNPVAEATGKTRIIFSVSTFALCYAGCIFYYSSLIRLCFSRVAAGSW